MRKRYIVIVIILGIIGILFRTVFIGGHVISCCDNLLISIPSQLFFQKEVLSGHIPLWNPYLFSGVPYLADLNLSPLYLWQFLQLFFSRLLSPFETLTIEILVHIFLATVGMYWCMRQLYSEQKGALFSALVFGSSGTMLTYTNNVSMLHVASIFPWVFGFFIRFVRAPTMHHALWFCIAAAIQLIAGHPQLTFYSWLLFTVYVCVFSSGESFLVRIGRILFVACLTLLLAAIQVLPFIEFSWLSTRFGRDLSYATFGSFPPLGIMRLMIPALVGSLRNGTNWWQGGSVYGYVGILPVLFLFASRFRNKVQRFWLTVLSISLLLSFGAYSPVYWVFYYLVPGISLFRVPSHFLFLATVSVSVLTGYTINQKKILLIRFPWHFLSIILLFAGVIGVFGSRAIAWYIFSIDGFPSKIQEKIAFLSTQGIEMVVTDTGYNLLIIALTMLCLSWYVQKATRVRYAALLSVFILDMAVYGARAIITFPKADVMRWREQAKSIQSQLPILSEYRYYVHPSVYPSGSGIYAGTHPFLTETAWQFSMLRPNIPSLFSLRLPDGYGSMILARYQEAFGNTTFDPTGVSIGKLNEQVVNEWSIRYVAISKRALEEIPHDFRLLNEYDTWQIWENQRAKPRYRLEGSTDLHDTVELIHERAGDILLRVHTEKLGTFVFGETWYPGWQATVNNKEVEIDHSQATQRIVLTPGTHRVHFRFRSLTFILGSVISGIALIVCMHLFFTKKRFWTIL